MNSIYSLQKKASQTTTNTLPIIQNIEFINKLIYIVATFCYNTKIRHQAKIITLLKNINNILNI